MRPRRMVRVSLFLAVALLALGSGGQGMANAGNHSGTVLKVDKAAGVLVLGEVGPWRVKRGATQITERVARVTSSTVFTRVARVSGAGPSGWIGGFVEEPLRAWDVKAGDFVTIEARPEDRRLTALKVTIVTRDEP